MSILERLFREAKEHRSRNFIPEEAQLDVFMNDRMYSLILADAEEIDPDSPIMALTTLFALGNLRFKMYEGEFQYDLATPYPQFVFE